MKQRKNAFTLIELLAVIIILAAIALIIAPLVLDIIKEQQMKTFKESINGILRSSRLEIVNSSLKFPATFTYSNGKLLSPTGKELKVTGKIPEGSGMVIYNSEDSIDLAITDQTWCGTYNKTSKEVEVNEFTGECGGGLPTPEYCFTFDTSTAIITGYAEDRNDCPTDVVIPETINGVVVKEIGDYSFSDKSLTSVVLSSGIEVIGEAAFKGYEEVAYFNQSSQTTLLKSKKQFNIRKMGTSSSGDNMIHTVDFSKAKNLMVIEYHAFSNNQLSSVDLSNLTNLTTIESGVFSDNQITSVDLSNLTNLTTIGSWAFSHNQIKSVDLSNLINLTTIEGQTFSDNQITSADLSNLTNLTTIEYYAFSDNQLTSISIPSSVTTIEEGAFNNNQLPDSQAFIYARNSDGSIDHTKVVSYGGLKRDNVVIPNSVTTIGEYAFEENQLTSISIPSSVTTIESGAFISNQLTSVTIPNSVITIGGVAFDNNQLTSVTIPNSVTAIGRYAFGDNQLTSVTIKGKSSSADFTSYPIFSPFGWVEGYSDANIIWNG